MKKAEVLEDDPAAELSADPAPDGAEDLTQEFDFGNIQPNKYAGRFSNGIRVVLLVDDADQSKLDNVGGVALLAPDVAEAFPDSESVNDALRLLIKIARQQKAA